MGPDRNPPSDRRALTTRLNFALDLMFDAVPDLGVDHVRILKQLLDQSLRISGRSRSASQLTSQGLSSNFCVR
jgi:hypothetical protein